MEIDLGFRDDKTNFNSIFPTFLHLFFVFFQLTSLLLAVAFEEAPERLLFSCELMPSPTFFFLLSAYFFHLFFLDKFEI